MTEDVRAFAEALRRAFWQTYGPVPPGTLPRWVPDAWAAGLPRRDYEAELRVPLSCCRLGPDDPPWHMHGYDVGARQMAASAGLLPLTLARRLAFGDDPAPPEWDPSEYVCYGCFRPELSVAVCGEELVLTARTLGVGVAHRSEVRGGSA